MASCGSRETHPILIMNYFDELVRSMTFLGQDPKTIFLGQAVKYAGTGMTNTLKGIDPDKLVEMPVCEDMQQGICNGLSLSGDFIPVSIFPRWNFALLATNQLINHLDKISSISEYETKVIVRIGIGSEFPLHPQAQHVGDFTDAFKLMCKTIEVIRLDKAEQIFPSYKKALERNDGRSTILVEHSDAFDQKWYEDNLANK